MMTLAQNRGDEWGLEVLGRLQGMNDLVAEEASYHTSCRSNFSDIRQHSGKGPGRPSDTDKLNIYKKFLSWFQESEIEDSVHTIDSLHAIMVNQFSEGKEVFGRKHFKSLLLADYGDTIYVTGEARRADVVCLRDRMNEILREHHSQADNEDEDMGIIKTASKLILNKCKTMKLNKNRYATLKEMEKPCPNLPPELTFFLSFFLKNPDLVDVWGQNFIKAVRPKSGVLPFQLGLAVQLDHKFGSKWLINRLHYLKLAESYDELQNYKWCLLRRLVLKELLEDPPTLSRRDDDPADCTTEDGPDEDNDAIITDSEPSQDEMDTTITSLDEDSSSQPDTEDLESISQTGEVDVNQTYQADPQYHRTGEQFVADNVDIQMTSVYGLKSIHAMGRIKVCPESPQSRMQHINQITERQKIKVSEKSRILKDLDISVQQYHPKKSDGFKKVQFIPFEELLSKIGKAGPCPGDVSWILGWMVKIELNPPLYQQSNWKGYMKSIHNKNSGDKSNIQFLQIIDSPPDKFSTVYTTLMECLRVAADSPIVITFDLPLWKKATRIVLELNLPVVVRLGGFHQLMSFNGSIGTLMTGSGIEECFKIIYPSFPVDKLLTGKSHYKTIRAYLLIDAALVVYLLDGLMTNDELENVYDYIQNRKETKDGVYVDVPFMTKMTNQLGEMFEQLKSSGHTQKLWAQLHDYVQVIRDFIRAERLSNAKLSMQSTAAMLPTMMAAGHTEYGKALRFALQKFIEYDGQIKAFYLTQNDHTVKYSTDEWAGVWSDMSIEQTLMRYCKSQGGLSGGRLRSESAQKVWLLTLTVFSAIHQTLEERQHPGAKDYDHADLGNSRMKDDYEKVVKLVEWFKTTDLLNTDAEKLVSFVTGEVNTDGRVNCHMASDIGKDMQLALDGGTFVSKVSRKSKCDNFTVLRKKLKVNQKAVYLAPYVMFTRLTVAAERKLTVKDSMWWELTIQPTSLFNDQHFMREAHKSKLGKHLKDKAGPMEADMANMDAVVVDGGWFIHQLKWEKGKSFTDIANSYVDYLKHLVRNRECIVVFDGYNNSPKDHEHRRRSVNSAGGVQVVLDPAKACTVTKEKFMGCSANKEQFISLLCTLLDKESNMRTCVVDDDADTLIVKEALQMSLTMSVEVLGEDTDLLILLIHHVNVEHKQIALTTRGGSYSIQSIQDNLNDLQRARILFIHSVSGCDTVSSIFRQGKVGMFTKLCQDTPALQDDVFSVLLSTDSSKDDIIEAGLKLFQYIYGNITTSLQDQRFSKYNKMTAKDGLHPEGLPPSSGAATQHILRAYLQYRDWLLLESMSIPPTDFGWRLDAEGQYIPIMTADEIGPPELLKLTACNCKKGCSKQCSCRKMGVHCISACGTCAGKNCSNTEVVEALEDIQLEEDYGTAD